MSPGALFRVHFPSLEHRCESPGRTNVSPSRFSGREALTFPTSSERSPSFCSSSPRSSASTPRASPVPPGNSGNPATPRSPFERSLSFGAVPCASIEGAAQQPMPSPQTMFWSARRGISIVPLARSRSEEVLIARCLSREAVAVRSHSRSHSVERRPSFTLQTVHTPAHTPATTVSSFASGSVTRSLSHDSPGRPRMSISRQSSCMTDSSESYTLPKTQFSCHRTKTPSGKQLGRQSSNATDSSEANLARLDARLEALHSRELSRVREREQNRQRLAERLAGATDTRRRCMALDASPGVNTVQEDSTIQAQAASRAAARRKPKSGSNSGDKLVGASNKDALFLGDSWAVTDEVVFKPVPEDLDDDFDDFINWPASAATSFMESVRALSPTRAGSPLRFLEPVTRPCVQRRTYPTPEKLQEREWI